MLPSNVYLEQDHEEKQCLTFEDVSEVVDGSKSSIGNMSDGSEDTLEDDDGTVVDNMEGIDLK